MTFYEGGEGGTLVFSDNGVMVIWNRNAALATYHATGNRKTKVTLPGGKRKPPKLSSDFATALYLREFALECEKLGNPYPSEPSEEELADLMKSGLAPFAWRLLYAALIGDAEPLRQFAEAVDIVERIRTNELETPIVQWVKIVDAIRNAAVKAGEPPTKNAVFKEWQLIVSDNEKVGKEDLREELGRMGFGWLPAPIGRTPKKPD